MKENEVAQKSAEYSKKSVLLDSLIENVQSYKSPVSIAKNVLEILKESMNEKGKRVTSDMIGVLTRNTDVYTDQIEHTAWWFSAWLPPIQCTLSGHQCMILIQGWVFLLQLIEPQGFLSCLAGN